MKKAFIFSLLALFVAVTGLSTHADAKRFGGGMSFGKSYSKQKSFSQPAPAKSINNQKAAPNRSGLMGMLGGLAMGGLLGALFFGGAFEGINFMDVLMFALIGFAIVWFMRRTAAQQQYAHAGNQNSPFAERNTHHDAFQASHSAATMAKPDIDEEYFTTASRNIFMRMQASWDAKNMNDIRSFCTPEISSKISADMEKLDDYYTKTEVSLLNARIEDSWIESGLEWVAVHYTAMLKEETLDHSGSIIESENSQVNEVWIFQHRPNSKDPTWYLAGIQQA